MEISIRNLTELIAEMIGFKGDIVWDATKPHGKRAVLWIRAVQNKNLHLRLVPNNAMVSKTLDWYLTYFDEQVS